MIKTVKIISLAALVCAAGANAAEKEKSEDSSESALKTGLELDVSVGLGYDSNIYRAPDSPYINFADACSTDNTDPQFDPNCDASANGNPNDTNGYVFVDPKVQSGMFIPAELALEYVDDLNQKNYLVTSYKFDGEFYTDSKYDNANNYAHKFRIGNEHVFRSAGSKVNSLYAGGLFEHKKRLYLDRDTGEEQTSSGNVDVSNRYTYDALGIEADYKNRISKLQYDIEAVWSVRDYEDPVEVSQYDHTYYRLGGDVKYQVAKPTKLTFGYKFYVYDYSERPSRSADGRLLKSNPTRKYDYNVFDITLRHRFSESWLAYFDYERKTRDDKYVGYDNYTKDLFKVRLHYDINKNNKIKVSYAYWERDYPNAYAFDNQAIGIPKEYDGTDLKVSSTTKLDKNKSVVVDFKYADENTTDLRYDYDRYKVFVSFQWVN
ncbi:MAG: hypothetical protein AMJ53_09750 [Gammaproteobacteria bacterium SG8_11]|nr:MAG: hypothetical protein AMJ53_09750 [Gammaproteobacteria bacterium SG8_11]